MDGTLRTGQNKTKHKNSNKRPRDLPPCLNPRCKDHHFISDCKMTSKEENSKFKEQWRHKKKKKMENNNTTTKVQRI